MFSEFLALVVHVSEVGVVFSSFLVLVVLAWALNTLQSPLDKAAVDQKKLRKKEIELVKEKDRL